MSFTSTLVQFSFPLLSVAELVRATFMLSLLASLLMFFRPLLTGIGRAGVLALRSCLSRKGTTGRAAGMDALPDGRA